jgi:hypothetical protein
LIEVARSAVSTLATSYEKNVSERLLKEEVDVLAIHPL